ncbi:MAG: universal stress protein [Candidatus Bathyarchaeota archaeon]
MFINILVAIDGSTYAAKALDYAVGLAEKFSSKISLVHVVPTMNAISPKLGSSGSKYVEEMIAGLEEEGRNILTVGEKTVTISNIAVKAILTHGDAADKIIEAAEETKADLIVVGDRGLGSGGRFPLGSIAYKVSQHAKCPVLIIK